MGCDIHAYIEFNQREDWWQQWGDIWIMRDYELFAHLAGVRNYTNVVPVSPPKGIPDKLSWEVEAEYTLLITEDPDDYGQCTPETAERYIASCGSVRLGDDRVTHPDWHTPSWLSLEEVKKVQSALKDREWKNVTFEAAVSAMCGLESTDGIKTRFTFWFDN